MQVFNARTQQLEDVTWHVEDNRELVATFADGSIVKFPAGTTEVELSLLVTKHAESNQGQEIITPEQEAAYAAERKSADDLVAKLNGNTMPQEQYNAELPQTESPGQPPVAPTAS